MWELKTLIERKYNVEFKDYHELHWWSVENVGAFWGETWDYTNIVSTGSFGQVSEDRTLDDKFLLGFFILCVLV